MKISYHDKWFRGVKNYDAGDFNRDTLFHYRQEAHVVWGTFHGGGVAFGTLVGVLLPGGEARMNWQYVSRKGEIRTGACTSIPRVLPDGRLELTEHWTIDGPVGGSGTSVVEEVTPADGVA